MSDFNSMNVALLFKILIIFANTIKKPKLYSNPVKYFKLVNI